MISLLYLDEDFILHDHIFTGAIPGAGMVGNWAPGKLVDEKLKVLPSSGLAVLQERVHSDWKQFSGRNVESESA
ncbi:hypothetical protein M7I_1885 [Glarea lozoyensis 74030]|uniref:Uncharacterized protein n=1 Tax=Glarea lozoyensis (strain ATCC 74030 / MF5533) TaxID=1104152 RepID=H0EHA8_GLAL7|nr:hypothetical protein M7I_1885 [Glarea lozoyensis 74030]